MDCVLVRATTEDVDDYIRIGGLNTSRFNITSTDPVRVLQEINESVVYMIQVVGKVVGLVSYKMRNPNHAYVSEVQVEPDFHGQGIGGYALAAILRELEAIQVVDLLTHPENPAQKLYRRHGFQETGEVFENHNDTGEPRMRMLLVRTYF
jgi:ribosomal protein S18 acetylase RimI-like enzyme